MFNPRLRIGLALTDGEGVERIWSAFRGLIGIERRSGVSETKTSPHHAEHL